MESSETMAPETTELEKTKRNSSKVQRNSSKVQRNSSKLPEFLQKTFDLGIGDQSDTYSVSRREYMRQASVLPKHLYQGPSPKNREKKEQSQGRVVCCMLCLFLGMIVAILAFSVSARAKRSSSRNNQRPLRPTTSIPQGNGQQGSIPATPRRTQQGSTPATPRRTQQGGIDVNSLEAIPELTETVKNSLIASTIDQELDDTNGDKITVKEVNPLSSKRRRRQASNALEILLLHGAAYSIDTWVQIETIYHLANWGYRTVAINLHGRSNDVIGIVVSQLNMKNLVIVSPSFSGGWSMPYLFDDPATSTDKARLFIPVAPVNTGSYIEKFKISQLPALIVYGDRDCCSANLKNLPNHQVAVIPNAGHACYNDNKEVWHKVLYTKLKEY